MPDSFNTSLISKAERPSVSSRIVYQSSAMFFSVSITIFIVASVAFGGLFFYNKTLDGTRQKLADSVKKARENFDREGGIGRLIQTANAFDAARVLLAQHVFSSNVFSFIQEYTHTRVKFDTMSFSRDMKKIDLSGAGASYRIVAEQISVLESNPQVDRVEFGGLSMTDKGLVNFKLTIFFKPSLLQLSLEE